MEENFLETPAQENSGLLSDSFFEMRRSGKRWPTIHGEQEEVAVPLDCQNLYAYQHYDGEWYLCDDKGRNRYIGSHRFKVESEYILEGGVECVVCLQYDKPVTLLTVPKGAQSNTFKHDMTKLLTIALVFLFYAALLWVCLIPLHQVSFTQALALVIMVRLASILWNDNDIAK